MQLVELAQRCIDETFAAARNLHPHQLARLGLARALDAAVDDLREASAVAIEADMSREDAGLDAALGARANHVYRVAQEALTNATRHAEAARIRLALRVDGATLIVTAEDDGRGFVGPSADGRASLGLLGMHERARLIGAELAITSSPGRGTTARLAVPLSPR